MTLFYANALRFHLIAVITVCYIVGISFSEFFSPSYLPVVIVPVIVLLIINLLLKRETIALLLLFFFFFWTGILAGSAAHTPPVTIHHINNQVVEEDVVVVGRVKSVSGFDGEVTRFDLQSISIQRADSLFTSVNGSIRYTLQGKLPDSILPGSMVAVRARLKHPRKFATPGAFDYPAYLSNLGIYVIGFIDSPLHVMPVQHTQSFREMIRYFPEQLRMKITRYIEYTLSAETGSIYKALLTGDRSSLSPMTIDLFKNTGCLHILAISGVHMSLLGIFLYTIFYWLLRRSEWLILAINTKKLAAACCILPLLFYTLIAGAKPPVLRSFVMSLAVILAVCYGKKHTFSALVTCAALLILALSPGQLFSPSFQLTFAAVIGIRLAITIITSIKQGILNIFPSGIAYIASWLVTGIGVSLAATLATAPLIIYHFNRISFVGVIANLIVEPLICLWSLILGFIAIPFIFLTPSFAAYLLDSGGIGISLSISALQSISSIISPSSIFLPSVSPLHILFYYLGFLPFFFMKSLRLRYRLLCFIIPVAAILLIVFPPKELTKPFVRESTIAFLDVGHGSCTYIEMPGGRKLLIDGGAITSPDFDIGERVIAPYLFRQGISKINDIVITHPDSDHYNGIVSIIRRFKVDTLWISVLEQNNPGWQNLLKEARNQKVTIHTPSTAETVYQSKSAALKIISNTTSPLSEESNNTALVVKYQHDNFSILFPGDISAWMERQLIKQGLDLQANLLLAGHHGSKTSSSEEFLRSVNPETMVVSSGSSNISAFPAAEVLARCKKQGIEVLPINRTGTITVKTEKGAYHVDTLLENHLASISH